MTTIKTVTNWMLDHHAEYSTCTALAEAAAAEFGHSEWLADSTHYVWDCAVVAKDGDPE